MHVMQLWRQKTSAICACMHPCMHTTNQQVLYICNMHAVTCPQHSLYADQRALCKSDQHYLQPYMEAHAKCDGSDSHA